MIIFLLIIAAIALFVSMTLISKTAIRIILSLISAVVVVGSSVLMVMNDREHFGMHKTTETTTQEIYSVSPSKQMNMLLYKSIGTADKERVYLYNETASQKTPSHTAADKTTNTVHTTTKDSARLVKKTTRWVYKNGTYQFWFGIAGNNREVSKRVNTFYVPKNWLTLSTTQATKLGKLVKQNQTQMKKDAAQYVKTKVTATVKATLTDAMKKDPTMSAADQKKLTEETTKKASAQFAAQYQAQAMQKLIEEAKK
ncbi:DUF4811 domain-containing protein [Pediococcus stilesii]|uniref:DUF4811 domain-containing protein n=1 Tax=Pediococcus stilesii TaxID=331679 RepID=A0A5R9BVR3_9LACO|nr:DUF4811 domain-containing protein [Pediococcus stilesii]TLQ04788.1 DUF4811 domain-containing protein [Pediococcus stilesii]